MSETYRDTGNFDTSVTAIFTSTRFDMYECIQDVSEITPTNYTVLFLMKKLKVVVEKSSTILQ